MSWKDSRFWELRDSLVLMSSHHNEDHGGREIHPFIGFPSAQGLGLGGGEYHLLRRMSERPKARFCRLPGNFQGQHHRVANDTTLISHNVGLED